MMKTKLTACFLATALGAFAIPALAADPPNQTARTANEPTETRSSDNTGYVVRDGSLYLIHDGRAEQLHDTPNGNMMTPEGRAIALPSQVVGLPAIGQITP